MILHKHIRDSSSSYIFLDKQERVILHPSLYLRHLQKHGRSQQSQKHTADVLKLYCKWIEENDVFVGVDIDRALVAIQDSDILDWIGYQRAKGNSEATINNREVLVREFYKWLTSADGGRVCKDIPWGSRTLTRSPHRPLPRFVTVEQVTRLLWGLHNESQRTAIHFMYDTGIRVSELVRLSCAALPNEDNWPDGVNYYPLLVPGSKSYDGSKFKYRYTIISRPMLARVRRYHSSARYALAKGWGLFDLGKPMFLTTGGRPLRIDSVQKAINAAWTRQGGGLREMSPHRLRHGTAFSVLQSEFGKELLDNMLVLKSIFGHSNISTTEIYSAIPIAALQSLSGKRQVRLKFEEAQRIYEDTYLPERSHKERRGHSV